MRALKQKQLPQQPSDPPDRGLRADWSTQLPLLGHWEVFCLGKPVLGASGLMQHRDITHVPTHTHSEMGRDLHACVSCRFDTGVISGALPYIRDDLLSHMKDQER